MIEKIYLKFVDNLKSFFERKIRFPEKIYYFKGNEQIFIIQWLKDSNIDTTSGYETFIFFF